MKNMRKKSHGDRNGRNYAVAIETSGAKYQYIYYSIGEVIEWVLRT